MIHYSSRRLASMLFLPLAVALMLVSSLTQAQDDYVWAPDFPVGSSIPEISAEDQNGKLRTFDDLVGENGMLFMLSRSFDW